MAVSVARMLGEQHAPRALFGILGILFAASAAVTIVWCTSMSAMGSMPMPGGWTMSMAWMRMPGQSWLSVATSFLGMWAVMMVAMMLPCLAPMLWRYRQAVGGAGPARLACLTACVGAGYFAIWLLFGMLVFPVGAVLATLAIQQPALAHTVPLLVGGVVLIAGALQFSPWKARQLACCREAGRGLRLPADVGTAWRHGLRLGRHCCYSCVGLTATLLVIGVMNLRVMAIVMAAIMAERLAPGGQRVAQAIGVIVIAAAAGLLARAVGLV